MESTEDFMLGYEMNDGKQVNLHIGLRDWNAQCALVEDTLHTYHIQLGNTDADIPNESILNAAYCIRNMRDNLVKLDEKVDQLIAENMELADKLDCATTGIEAVVLINKRLGEENELLRKELKAHGLLGTQEAPPEEVPLSEIQK